MNLFFKKGISLLEILIVIAIILIIVAISVSQLSGLRQNQALKNTSESVISSFYKAKSQTMASLNSSQYGLHFQADKVVIFKGDNYQEDDENNETINIVAPATISNISLTGGVSNFYFSKLNGVPSRIGSITVSIISNQNLVKTITISPAGSMSVN